MKCCENLKLRTAKSEENLIEIILAFIHAKHYLAYSNSIESSVIGRKLELFDIT